MICLNCKKQIPDNSASCPYCGNQVVHSEQLPEEIKFRRYQRWAFYAIVSLVFLVMLGIIVKVSNTNSKYIASINTLKQSDKQKADELDKAKTDLTQKDQTIQESQMTLADKEKKMQELNSTLQQTKEELLKKNEELSKKTNDYKSVLDERMSLKTGRDKCEIGLNSADANIYSLIIKLGVGVTNKDLAKIGVADSNLNVGTDTDGDGLSDAVESAIGTDVNKKDTDGDGFDDKKEVLSGFNPKGTGSLKMDTAFANRMKGRILLQVESRGEAWYVSPGDGKRYFLGSPADAFRVMRDLDYWTKDWKKDHAPVVSATNQTSNSNSTEQIVSSGDTDNTTISTTTTTTSGL